jgi:hypothetical protein
MTLKSQHLVTITFQETSTGKSKTTSISVSSLHRRAIVPSISIRLEDNRALCLSNARRLAVLIDDVRAFSPGSVDRVGWCAAAIGNVVGCERVAVTVAVAVVLVDGVVAVWLATWRSWGRAIVAPGELDVVGSDEGGGSREEHGVKEQHVCKVECRGESFWK